ncbi:DUF6297 family protein [Cellulosimicrobium funkei]|uniref:DUF6297 family protein n=1 Tax=Cellulosimicrobium funkei TaxID=264251 RepID=UPI0037DD0370
MAHGPSALRSDPDELLTGRELRRLTARAAAARADAGPGEIVVDVAYAVVSVALATGWVVGLASMLRSTLATTVPTGGPPVLGPGALQALGTTALLAFLAGTAVRLGPVGAGGGGVRWWVPTPADRRGLLSPSFARAVVLGAALGTLGSAVVAVAAGLDAVAALRAGATGGALGLLLVAVAGLAQPSARAAGVLARASDVAVAAVPVAGLALVVAGRSGLPSLDAPLVVVLGLLVVAALLVLRWWRGLESLGATVLRAQSAVADQVGGAVLSFDTRDLGRALRRAGAARFRVRRPRRFAAVRGPVGAVVAADLVLLGRSPSALAQLVGLAALTVVAQQVPGLGSGFGLFVLLVAAGLGAAVLGAEGARTAEMAPVVDALVPLRARWTRLARGVVPTLTATACLAAGTAPLAVATGDARWLAVAVLTAVVQGAAAVRSAYREPPDWGGPLLATPSGGLPTGAAAVLRKGPDVAVLGAVPLGVALLVGTAGWGVMVAQALAAVVGVAVATRVRALR